MKFIPQDEIKISPTRQRREHDPSALQELITSIEANGLLHCPVLRKVGEGWVLVAGERRLRAIREIHELGGTLRHGIQAVPTGSVPYLDMGELSPLAAEEAELEENIRRVDLTWQERAVAEDRLLRLRETQALMVGKPPPALSTIARETRGEATPTTVTSVQRNIVLSRNLHRPEVASAKSAAEAMKALLRVEETERNVEKAAALGRDFLGSKHTLTNGDCLPWLTAYTGPGFDVVCMDPPYGMGADEFGDSGGGAAGPHFYEDGEAAWSTTLSAANLLSRITKPDAHVYIFCDFDRFHELRGVLTLTGWRVFRTPLLWFKPSAYRAPWPEHGPQRKYECILYAVKGDLKCTKMAGDVLTYPPDENLGHQAQKPIPLIQDLLSRSVRPGMLVLDPFCGTGTIFPATHALSGVATGIELDPAAYGVAATRLELLKEGK